MSRKPESNLKSKAQKELLRLEAVFENADVRQKIDNIKDKFSICEIVYKKLLKPYLENKNKKISEHLQITMNQVPSVFSYAGYSLEYDLLNNIFGSKKKSGEHSVKKLRDELNHSLKENAIIELMNRHDELNTYMDSFLDTIKAQSNT